MFGLLRRMSKEDKALYLSAGKTGLRGSHIDCSLLYIDRLSIAWAFIDVCQGSSIFCVATSALYLECSTVLEFTVNMRVLMSYLNLSSILCIPKVQFRLLDLRCVMQLLCLRILSKSCQTHVNNCLILVITTSYHVQWDLQRLPSVPLSKIPTCYFPYNILSLVFWISDWSQTSSASWGQNAVVQCPVT